MYKKLILWQNAIDFVEKAYSLTGSFPKNEQYGLVSQIRRAAVSVPSNISEGATRKSKKEFQQFLYIALSSLSEVETQLIIANRLGYVDSIEELSAEIIVMKKMTNKLISSLKTRN